jgi:hypothetical protein
MPMYVLYIYIYIYIYMYVCIDTHTHTHTQTNTHTDAQAMLDNGSIRSSIVGGLPRGEISQPLPAKAANIPLQHKSLPVGAAKNMLYPYGDVLRPHSMPANQARPQSAAAVRPAPAPSAPSRPTSGVFLILLYELEVLCAVTDRLDPAGPPHENVCMYACMHVRNTC